jgi:hypothetical protein
MYQVFFSYGMEYEESGMFMPFVERSYPEKHSQSRNFLTSHVSTVICLISSNRKNLKKLVMTPHFSEKILLSMRDLIREYEGFYHNSLTLLEYLVLNIELANV